MLRRVKRNVYDMALVVLSWVIPKRKYLIVLTANNTGSFSGNPKYLYRHYEVVGKEPVWVARSEAMREKVSSEGVTALHTYSLKAFLATLRARLIIIDHAPCGPFASGTLAFLGRFKIIQTWHGTGVKGWIRMSRWASLKRQPFLRSNYAVLASSSEHKGAMMDLFKSNRVYVTGSPRNDILLEPPDNPRHRVIDGVRYDKVLLYAPTLRKTAVFRPFDDTDALEELLASRNMLLLVRKHPSDPAVWPLVDTKHIKDISGEHDDVQELLRGVDMLITDYSSISTDFSLTDRPIIFYLPDHEDFDRRQRFAFDLDILPGEIAYDQETLMRLLSDLEWTQEEEYRSEYGRFKAIFHDYPEGGACERVAALLEGL